MLPPIVRRLVLNTIAGTPDVLDSLTARVSPTRPGTIARIPSDFSLREVLSHLADWNPIFLARIERTVAEDQPIIEDIDEGRMVIDHDYAHADPRECLARFRATRDTLARRLNELPEDAWDRIAHRHLGPISVEGQAVLLMGHDGYHLREVAQWLGATGS